MWIKKGFEKENVFTKIEMLHESNVYSLLHSIKQTYFHDYSIIQNNCKSLLIWCEVGFVLFLLVSSSSSDITLEGKSKLRRKSTKKLNGVISCEYGEYCTYIIWFLTKNWGTMCKWKNYYEIVTDLSRLNGVFTNH